MKSLCLHIPSSRPQTPLSCAAACLYSSISRPIRSTSITTSSKQAISSRTKAICAVHYAGVPAEMDEIVAIAREYSLLVIEDAAQAIGSTYHDRPVGKLGDLAAFSFHETKNVISGEGGALVVADEKFIERAHIIRDKGTNRKAFFQGQTDKYTWVDIGSSFLPGELVAAYLYAQLLRQGAIISDRIRTWSRYRSELQQFENYNVRLPTVPSHVYHNGHMFYLLLPDAELRRQIHFRDGEPFHHYAFPLCASAQFSGWPQERSSARKHDQYRRSERSTCETSAFLQHAGARQIASSTSPKGSSGGCTCSHRVLAPEVPCMRHGRTGAVLLKG